MGNEVLVIRAIKVHEQLEPRNALAKHFQFLRLLAFWYLFDVQYSHQIV